MLFCCVGSQARFKQTNKKLRKIRGARGVVGRVGSLSCVINMELNENVDATDMVLIEHLQELKGKREDSTIEVSSPKDWKKMMMP